MAAATAITMVDINERKKAIHPFFDKPTSSNPVSSLPTDTPLTPQSDAAEVEICIPLLTSSDNKLEPIRHTSLESRSMLPEGIAKPTTTLCDNDTEADLNQSRRKRRKTTPPKAGPAWRNHTKHKSTSPSGDSNNHLLPSYKLSRGSPERGDNVAGGLLRNNASGAAPLSYGPESQTEHHQVPRSMANIDCRMPSTARDTADTIRPTSITSQVGQATSEPIEKGTETVEYIEKPKKILHFNIKTGTIGSPPKIPTRGQVGPAEQVNRSKGRRSPKSLVVALKYGQDTSSRLSIGSRIDQILSDIRTSQPSEKQKLEIEAPRAKSNSTKSTHPFFLGKAAVKPSSNGGNEGNDTIIDLTTAGYKQTALPRVTTTSQSTASPNFSSSNGHGFVAFGNSGKLMKFPGAAEPIWPPRSMTHIRGLEDGVTSIPVAEPSKLCKSEEHKSKYTASVITPDEDILKIITAKLEINAVRKDLKEVDVDHFDAPDRCLRLPERHFESGYKLQQRIRPQLKSAVTTGHPTDDSSDDELSRRESRSPHAAIKKLYDSIPLSLSAFDKSQYQTQSWIHKYSPHSAAEVLQSGREAFILKDWLQSLTVMAVDTGAGDAGNTRVSPGDVKAERDRGDKKKRKSKKLDDFIVSSGDEADDMDEVSEPDEESLRGGLHIPKTVIRRGDAMMKGSKEPNKLLNAVVISGPNGCGKTAAVYAVAKELGFEVFEINSSSRRSGKDILEKVGDMTKNHLVQQTQREMSDDADDLQRATDALDADLKSGRQGTMKSFFKSAAPKVKGPSTKKLAQVTKSTSTSANVASSKKPKQQKQSLILFEEVDILFEEDKQFWATVLGLIAQSKRPVILTCNDESLVLNQPLPLHAIIRFAPPPLDLAVDYMLLVAASEGHVLQRQAVTALYRSQKFDLRASMTELEFWCQIGVGDRRGGFDWFIPRLPPGIDKDSHGNTIRVVSENTYRTGMGWLGRDSLCDSSGINGIEEEALRQTWDGWQLDAGDWHETLKLTARPSKKTQLSKSKCLRALEAYDGFSDAMSTADLCTSGSLNPPNYIPLDTTAPPPSSQIHADYPLGRHLLPTQAVFLPSPLPLTLPIAIKSLARSLAASSLRTLRRSLSPPTEHTLLSSIIASRSNPPKETTRLHYSLALDPLGTPDRPLFPAPYLEASCIDRPMSVLATDVAPYVRGIVRHDARTAGERIKAGRLLCEGGRVGKKARTTRAAAAAGGAAGGRRARREWWFEGVGVEEAERTGGVGWGSVGVGVGDGDGGWSGG